MSAGDRGNTGLQLRTVMQVSVRSRPRCRRDDDPGRRGAGVYLRRDFVPATAALVLKEAVFQLRQVPPARGGRSCAIPGWPANRLLCTLLTKCVSSMGVAN